MSQEDKDIEIKQEEAGTPEEATAAAVRPPRKGAATVAFVLAVLAWVFLPVFESVALAAAIIGLAVSVAALRQPRGAWRNLALVSLVACSVLLLVLAIFWTALLILL